MESPFDISIMHFVQLFPEFLLRKLGYRIAQIDFCLPCGSIGLRSINLRALTITGEVSVEGSLLILFPVMGCCFGFVGFAFCSTPPVEYLFLDTPYSKTLLFYLHSNSFAFVIK